jgi:hypothetical protein
MERRTVCAMKCFRKGTSRVNTIVETAGARAGYIQASIDALRNFTPLRRDANERANTDVPSYLFFLPSPFLVSFFFSLSLSPSLSLFFLPLKTTRAHSVEYFHNSGNI